MMGATYSETALRENYSFNAFLLTLIIKKNGPLFGNKPGYFIVERFFNFKGLVKRG